MRDEEKPYPYDDYLSHHLVFGKYHVERSRSWPPQHQWRTRILAPRFGRLEALLGLLGADYFVVEARARTADDTEDIAS